MTMAIPGPRKIYRRLIALHPWIDALRKDLHTVFILSPCYVRRDAVTSLKRRKATPHETKFRRFITYNATGEGIGGLMVRYTAARILALEHGLTYVHRPFPECFHYTCDFDDFLGFGRDDPKLAEVSTKPGLATIDLPEFNYKRLHRLRSYIIAAAMRSAPDNSDVLFITSGFSNAEPHKYYPELEQSLVGKNRATYIEQRKKLPIPSPFRTGKIKVAAQIRRAEITEMKEKKTYAGKARWRSNDWYLSIIRKINGIFGEDAVDIQIYSDESDSAKMDAFKALANTTINLKKDDPDQPFKAFHAMVVCDIAICSISGFSIESARLSDGLKIIPKSLMGYERILLGEIWMHIDDPEECEESLIRRIVEERRQEG